MLSPSVVKQQINSSLIMMKECPYTASSRGVSENTTSSALELWVRGREGVRLEGERGERDGGRRQDSGRQDQQHQVQPKMIRREKSYQGISFHGGLEPARIPKSDVLQWWDLKDFWSDHFSLGRFSYKIWEAINSLQEIIRLFWSKISRYIDVQ